MPNKIKWVHEIKLLTLEELAMEWHISTLKIHEWIKEGLPYTKTVNSKNVSCYQFNLYKCQRWYRQEAW